MNLDDIYTPLEEAKKELERRWNDQELKKKVEDYIGKDNLPEYFFEKPHAISIEDVVTPNVFSWMFISMAQKIELDPFHLEYLDDVYHTINKDKTALVKLGYYHGLDDNGDMIKSVNKLLNDSKIYEGKKIKEILTKNGTSLVDFHHRIFFKNFPNAKVFDGSKWFTQKGGCAKEYYKYLLAMTISHGILFDNFLEHVDYESNFIQNVLIPAFEDVEKLFGCKPMIVPVAPTHEVYGDVWWCYPEFIKTMIE